MTLSIRVILAGCIVAHPALRQELRFVYQRTQGERTKSDESPPAKPCNRLEKCGGGRHAPSLQHLVVAVTVALAVGNTGCDCGSSPAAPADVYAHDGEPGHGAGEWSHGDVAAQREGTHRRRR